MLHEKCMNYYEKTLKALDDTKTIAAHMISLGKIRSATEDEQLKYFIASLLTALQFPHLHRVPKPMPISLLSFNLPETHRLHDYCMSYFIIRKPEWQVIAERKGWSPP